MTVFLFLSLSFFLCFSLDSLTSFLMGDVSSDSLLRLPVSRESKVGRVCVTAKTLIVLT